MEATQPILFQKCQNCEKQIKSQIIDLHLRYCLKNIKKCTRCSRFYDINMTFQHQEQFHTKQKCQHCTNQFEVDQIDSHQQQCTYKFVLCAYCDLKIPQSISESHIKVCGSRTQQCEVCLKIIPVKDKQDHSLICWQLLQGEQRMKAAIPEEQEKDTRNRRGRPSAAIQIFQPKTQKFRKTGEGRVLFANKSENRIKQQISSKEIKPETNEKKKTIGQFIENKNSKKQRNNQKNPIVIEDKNEYEECMKQGERLKKQEGTCEKKKKKNIIVDLESSFIKQEKRQDKKSQ